AALPEWGRLGSLARFQTRQRSRVQHLAGRSCFHGANSPDGSAPVPVPGLCAANCGRDCPTPPPPRKGHTVVPPMCAAVGPNPVPTGPDLPLAARPPPDVAASALAPGSACPAIAASGHGTAANHLVIDAGPAPLLHSRTSASASSPPVPVPDVWFPA